MSDAQLFLGDCLDILPTLEAGSVDSVITDPPYGLEFMGKDWDRGVPGVVFWQEALRVAKPGASLLAFGGTRTHHRLMCAIEDAGWEIRDTLMWLYGSGFPKSHDISKAIDKAAGAEREVVGTNPYYCEGRTADPGEYRQGGKNGSKHITTPATDAAALWDGWGTALKPAYEPIILAMKPRDGTFANNALEHGVAGIWVDGTRIATGEDLTRECYGLASANGDGWKRPWHETAEKRKWGSTQGRWPANLLLSHSPDHPCPDCDGMGQLTWEQWIARTEAHGGTRREWDSLTEGGAIVECAACHGTGITPGCVRVGVRKVKGNGRKDKGNKQEKNRNSQCPALPPGTSWGDPDGTETVDAWHCVPGCPVAMLDEQSGERTNTRHMSYTRNGDGFINSIADAKERSWWVQETGGASRFFYCAKASRSERELGLLGHIPCLKCGELDSETHINPKTGKEEKCHRNGHPTVKPLDVCRWLCRLTKTPTGGVVLDPFMGSGRIPMAAVLEGRDVIGIEIERPSYDIAYWATQWAQEQIPEMVQAQMALA